MGGEELLLTEIASRVEQGNQILLQACNALHSLYLKLDSIALSLKVKSYPSDIRTMTLTVPTAGTAVQLPLVEILPGMEVQIKAISTNAGLVYIGNSKAAAEDTKRAWEITATASPIKLKVKNLNELWLNVASAGDGVNWLTEQEGE